MQKGDPHEQLEAMLIQYYHRRGSLIKEQQPYDHNPLYDCIQETRSQSDNNSTTLSQEAPDTSTRNVGIT